MPHVPGCDGGHCTQNEPRQLRRLPWGDSNGGASILCHACYEAEMRHRKYLNTTPRNLGMPLPKWSELTVYPTEE